MRIAPRSDDYGVYQLTMEPEELERWKRVITMTSMIKEGKIDIKEFAISYNIGGEYFMTNFIVKAADTPPTYASGKHEENADLK